MDPPRIKYIWKQNKISIILALWREAIEFIWRTAKWRFTKVRISARSGPQKKTILLTSIIIMRILYKKNRSMLKWMNRCIHTEHYIDITDIYIIQSNQLTKKYLDLNDCDLKKYLTGQVSISSNSISLTSSKIPWRVEPGFKKSNLNPGK